MVIGTDQPLGLGRPSEVCRIIWVRTWRVHLGNASLVGGSLSGQSAFMSTAPELPYRGRVGTSWPVVVSIRPALRSTSIPTHLIFSLQGVLPEKYKIWTFGNHRAILNNNFHTVKSLLFLFRVIVTNVEDPLWAMHVLCSFFSQNDSMKLRKSGREEEAD